MIKNFDEMNLNSMKIGDKVICEDEGKVSDFNTEKASKAGFFLELIDEDNNIYLLVDYKVLEEEEEIKEDVTFTDTELLSLKEIKEKKKRKNYIPGFILLVIVIFLSYFLFSKIVNKCMANEDKYYDSGKYEMALICYNIDLLTHPYRTGLWGRKGNCYLRLGKYDDAIKCYDKDLTYSPNDQVSKHMKREIELIKKQKPIKPEMVYIKGGTFQMGSNEDDSSKPVHTVTVDNFYIGKYEVTNKEYCEFLNSAGNQEEGERTWIRGISGHEYVGIIQKGDKFIVKRGYEYNPVVNITWYGAVAYCNWLSDREGLVKCYGEKDNRGEGDIKKKGYRLPTEAEWEYACRAGTTTEYYWGNEIDGSYCWYGDNRDRGGCHHKVGLLLPNGYNLYDMSGNVSEWCNDWYDRNYYSQSPSNNPVGPSSGSSRVIRGGKYSDTEKCKSASRHQFEPDQCLYYFGFRSARTP